MRASCSSLAARPLAAISRPLRRVLSEYVSTALYSVGTVQSGGGSPADSRPFIAVQQFSQLRVDLVSDGTVSKTGAANQYSRYRSCSRFQPACLLKLVMNDLFGKLSKIKDGPRPDQNTAGNVLKLPNTICFRSNFLFNFIYIIRKGYLPRVITHTVPGMINCPSKLASSNFKVGTRHQYFRYFGLGFHTAPVPNLDFCPGQACKTIKTSCRRRCPGLARAVATAFLLAAGFTGAVFSSQRV